MAEQGDTMAKFKFRVWLEEDEEISLADLLNTPTTKDEKVSINAATLKVFGQDYLSLKEENETLKANLQLADARIEVQKIDNDLLEGKLKMMIDNKKDELKQKTVYLGDFLDIKG